MAITGRVQLTELVYYICKIMEMPWFSCLSLVLSPCKHQAGNCPGAARLEDCRGGFQAGAGRDYVVYQNNTPPGNIFTRLKAKGTGQLLAAQLSAGTLLLLLAMSEQDRGVLTASLSSITTGNQGSLVITASSNSFGGCRHRYDQCIRWRHITIHGRHRPGDNIGCSLCSIEFERPQYIFSQTSVISDAVKAHQPATGSAVCTQAPQPAWPLTLITTRGGRH
jgi:hypothetical protein